MKWTNLKSCHFHPTQSSDSWFVSCNIGKSFNGVGNINDLETFLSKLTSFKSCWLFVFHLKRTWKWTSEIGFYRWVSQLPPRGGYQDKRRILHGRASDVTGEVSHQSRQPRATKTKDVGAKYTKHARTHIQSATAAAAAAVKRLNRIGSITLSTGSASSRLWKWRDHP